MRANANAVERTVILTAAVVPALGDVAFDAVICLFGKMAHASFLLFESTLSVPMPAEMIPGKFSKYPKSGDFCSFY